jgi:hypothetical protein
MTKRFTYSKKAHYYGNIIDNGKMLKYTEVVDLLNELSEDNALLNEITDKTIDFMYDNFDLNIIFTDRELNNICNEMGWELSEKGIKIHQLEKENKQLKEQLKQSVFVNLDGEDGCWNCKHCYGGFCDVLENPIVSWIKEVSKCNLKKWELKE